MMTTPRIVCRRLAPTVAAASLAITATASAVPADWPQWRGPARNGISAETGWSSTGRDENVWTASVGLGYSSFAVRNGRLYTMGFDKEKGQDTVFCLDALTGTPIWTHAYPAKVWDRMHGGGTLTTPSIDGDVVYTLNREGRFFRFKVADGEVEWSRNLVEELEVTPPTWGFSASPLVLDDMLVLNVGSVVAVDKTTGKTLWKTRDLGHAYSTPATMEVGGRACLAVFNGAGFTLVDRGSGEELGFHEWKTMYEINAATPVVLGGDKVFISSGLNRGCAMVHCKPDGLDVLWESKVMRTKMSGCVLVGGHLYGFDDSMLKCIDLEGNEKWRARGVGNGSLMAADGRLIVIGSKGELIIAAADPGEYKELSRTKCLSGGVYWTMPVLVDGLIYCRSSEGSIVCRDHRPQARAGVD
jgi:outer membrane protein assembly factor BamB